MKKFLAALALLALGGCQTNDDMAGEGPLTVTPRVQATIDYYMNEVENPLALAISTDGTRAYWYHCTGPQCYPGAAYETVMRCQNDSNGVPCKIYAHKRQVVWRGEVGLGRPSAELQGDLPASMPLDNTMVELHWDGHGKVFGTANGDLRYSGIFVSLDQQCRGTFVTSGETGNWDVTCNDGRKAEGTYSLRRQDSGQGTDQDGRKVRVIIQM